MPFLFAWLAYRAMRYGVWDAPRNGGYFNFGTSIGGMGFSAVFSAFIVHDWWLLWLARRPVKGLVLDSEGMRRNPNHPDWIRAYQKKPRIQKRSDMS